MLAETDRATRIFQVLSAGTRVRMIELLKRRPMCVNALAGELGVTPAAVSQHLRILRNVGLVEADKRGYFVHYRVNEATLREWTEVAGSVLSGGGT